MIQENITTPVSKNKGYILIIDDDDIRSMFASHLENHGYQVNMAKDGSEAKSLIDQNIYDIALLDIGLPDCNGLDLLKELKEIHPTLEVIVCTGNSEDYDFFGTVKAGATDWISKPCNLQELHAKI
jgi:two-component system NtrC family response regulator